MINFLSRVINCGFFVTASDVKAQGYIYVCLTMKTELKTGSFLLIHSRNSVEKIAIETISYIAARGVYSIIYYEGNKLVSSKPIGVYEGILPMELFIRCHHSYIVNKVVIKSIKKCRGLLLRLVNDDEIPVSVRRRHQFLSWLCIDSI
jgi:two-component system LytT family response regulator